jgi:predicted kinase
MTTNDFLLHHTHRLRGESMTTTVTVLVGVPGSGKSHHTESLTGAVVVSADHYFVELGGGTYAFDPSKLGAAHGQCLRRYTEALQRGESHVVVDNTNTTSLEMAPYVSLALAYGYRVEIVRVTCDPAVAAARNTHGVPEGAIRAMHERITATFQTGLPPFWPVTVRMV